MKIALVLSSAPGYSETFFNSQIKGLKENGHEVTLFTGPISDTYKHCKHVRHPSVSKFYVVQLFRMFYRSLTLLPNFKSVKSFVHLEKKEGTPIKRIIEKIYLNAALLKFQGDWIHFGFATTVIDRELVPKAIGARMAVSFRGYDINVFPLKHKNCYELLWRQVDKVHSISNYLLKKAYDLGLDRNKPFQIIHPAVDLESLPETKNLRTDGKFKIVTIARFGWIKGLELLTEVAQILKNNEFDFEWILIGTGSSSEQERFLFDMNEKQLQQHLFHKGLCSHKETLDILKDCDVYVQTSLNEGFCNAVLEAQALGIPCVAFKVGGLSENISDGETGWLIKPYDTITMARAITNVYSLSKSSKINLSEETVMRVNENFGLVQQKDAFNEFYKSF